MCYRVARETRGLQSRRRTETAAVVARASTGSTGGRRCCQPAARRSSGLVLSDRAFFRSPPRKRGPSSSLISFYASLDSRLCGNERKFIGLMLRSRRRRHLEPTGRPIFRSGCGADKSLRLGWQSGPIYFSEYINIRNNYHKISCKIIRQNDDQSVSD